MGAQPRGPRATADGQNVTATDFSGPGSQASLSRKLGCSQPCRVLFRNRGPGLIPAIGGGFEPLQEQRCCLIVLEAITQRVEAARNPIGERLVERLINSKCLRAGSPIWLQCQHTPCLER